MDSDRLEKVFFYEKYSKNIPLKITLWTFFLTKKK